MYIKTATITNVRSIANLTWQIQEDQAAGWHVILGDNGAGKTAFVRSLAFALIGGQRAFALRLDWSHWLRSGEERGQVKLNLVRDMKWDETLNLRGVAQEETQQSRTEETISAPSESMLNQQHMQTADKVDDKVYEYPSVTVSLRRDNEKVIPGWKASNDTRNSARGYVQGWFSASYGPFRRFSGENKGYEKVIETDPKLARHLTTFDENVGLSEGLSWLRELRFKQLEEEPEGNLLELVKAFVNQDDFLPFGVCLKSVSSKGVEFVDGNDYRIPAEELSNGYRSVLSLTFDLIRQLVACYGSDKVFDPADPTKIVVPGVVLIDEVDAHLHPTWQRRIGVWFRKHFPNIQFIVTTHSPFVCQAATTVFKLPTPGTDEQGEMICGTELNRLLYGNVLDAYSTGAFGNSVGRSEEGLHLMKRLATLNLKELHEGLSEAEEEEQDELRAMMPTAAHIMDREVSAK